jgi:hypothetical protein
LHSTGLHLIFCPVERRQSGIEIEIEPLRIASLSITQAGKLFRVSENEFNVEPRLVILPNQLGIEFNIGRK